MKIIPISGIIGWDVYPRMIREALEEAGGAPIRAEFASPGGFISDGLEIANLFRNYSGETTARLTGFAMSMSSYIPMVFDNIEAEDNAVFMIHNAGGGVFGDHNDIIKYGTHLKGLSGLLSKAYSKRSGIDLEEIAKMMDETTFYYGDEMLAAGFVDKMIESSGEKDKDSAIATAQASFGSCVALMHKEHAKSKEDMQQLAKAMVTIDFKAKNSENSNINNPAVAGNPKKEVQQMSLKQLLADNPAAQVEYDSAITAARAEGEKAGNDAMAATIDKVAPFLQSKEYPAKIAETALEVLKGTEPMGTLTASVAAVDAVREEAKNNAAKGESGNQEETPGEQPDQYVPGAVVKDQAGLDAEIARMQQGG